MNITSLMIHGFSAISSFTDVVIGRIIPLLVAATIVTTIAIIGIVIAKFSGAFVPGYATHVILFLVSVLMLCLFNGFLLILSLLAKREKPSAIPGDFVAAHVRDVVIIRSGALQAATE
jgi:polyisoprenyl-phosphate glycosyltransferase